MKEQEATNKYCPVIKNKCLVSECMFWVRPAEAVRRATTKKLIHSPKCSVRDSKEIFEAGLNECPVCNAPVIFELFTPQPAGEDEGICAYVSKVTSEAISSTVAPLPFR